MENLNNKFGVIVGRFQVPELTEGHKHLFVKACLTFKKIIIILGDTKTFPSGYKRMDSHDPYSFELRKTMILEWANEYTMLQDKLYGIYKIEDIGNLGLWNEKLDQMLEFLGEKDYVMVGSRDSFAQGYRGKYPVHIIESDDEFKNISGTEERQHLYKTYAELIRSEGNVSSEFRKGILWGLMEKETLESLKNDGKQG